MWNYRNFIFLLSMGVWTMDTFLWTRPGLRWSGCHCEKLIDSFSYCQWFRVNNFILKRKKEKERKRKGRIFLYTMYISKRSGMDHTVLPANTPCLPFLRMRSPDSATSNWGKRHIIAAYYSSIDPEGMKGWVGLVGWPIADGLPT